MHRLTSPAGSHVRPVDLLREVDEYFSVGASVAPGDTVVDVGANLGAFSFRVAERCGGNVRLLCFEPSAEMCHALSDNFARHPLLMQTRHTIFRTGLTSHENAGRVLPFYFFRRFPTNSTFDLASKRREFEIFFEDRGRRTHATLARTLGQLGDAVGQVLERAIASLPRGAFGWWVARTVMGVERREVRLEALDRVLASERVSRVDLLKIDVEGLELEVLRGMSRAAWARVRQVVLEINDVAHHRRAIESLLRENGFDEVRMMPQGAADNGLESVVLFARRAS